MIAKSAAPVPSWPPSEFVVFSHLLWDWVWQRPQHLISRLARSRQRTWFVEEPLSTDIGSPRLVREDVGAVVRVHLEVPGGKGRLDFGAREAETYADELADFFGNCELPIDAWLYTPMALPLAEALAPRLLVYDVMDDLSSFSGAPRGLVLLQRRALEQADVVFTGGRSLHRSVRALRSRDVHLFPSGVELAHYARSRVLRRPHRRPVAGYVGVVDERLDLVLLGELAAALGDWDIEMVGPVAKIEADVLPKAPNLRYRGFQPYDKLPSVMAGFDVALMPFALNEATRAISPTKTLEYLAAGLPVVSTRVRDVVADFGSVVHLADGAQEFAAACRHVVDHSRAARDRQVAPIARRHEWDFIAAQMDEMLQEAVVPAAMGSETA